MAFDVGVYAVEIGLVDHGEFEVLRFIGRGAGGEVEVEGSLEDGGVGDGVDGVEGKVD